MNSSYYLRAQNFAAPSVNENDLKYNSFGYNDDSMNNENTCFTNNIMFNSRVCRGNTFSTPVLTEEQRRNRNVYERTQLARRSSLERRRKEKFERPVTPPPVSGRVHVMIQTDGTLEDVFGSNHVEIMHSDGTIENGGRGNGGAFKHDISRDNKRLDLVTENKNEISTDQKLNDIFKDVDIAQDAHFSNNMARTVHEETDSDDANSIFQEVEITDGIHMTKNMARAMHENAKNYSITSTHLTKNIARSIYEEAKNDAITRIGQGPTYNSD